jgi:hypothetical protein
VALTGLDPTDLSAIDVLWILNGNNDAYNSEITSNLASLLAFVETGGVLSMHDRRVEGADTILPGAGATVFVRDVDAGGDDRNIDIVNGGTTVTNGPGGVLNDSSLDNGNFSQHGYAMLATLPVGGMPIFSRMDPAEIVDFYYPFGAGFVYYSSIPLDFYLAGAGPDPPRDNLRFIYAPNELAFQAELAGAAPPIPEPGTLLLFGTGLGALAVRRARRATRRQRQAASPHETQ